MEGGGYKAWSNFCGLHLVEVRKGRCHEFCSIW